MTIKGLSRRPRRVRHQAHLEALAKIPGIEVISLAGSNMESARAVAQQWKIPHWTANLADSLAQPGLDAVILTTPTQMHAAQGEQCMRAGKHVMIEIPMADSAADSERLVRVQGETGVVAMAGHTRRFNPSHQWIHNRISSPGNSRFCRWMCKHISSAAPTPTRSASRAAGPITCCGIMRATQSICSDIETGENITQAYALEGPKHPVLMAFAMDIDIGLKDARAVPSAPFRCRSTTRGLWAPSFAPSCDNGTYIARYDPIGGRQEQSIIDVSKVDVSMNGI